MVSKYEWKVVDTYSSNDLAHELDKVQEEYGREGWEIFQILIEPGGRSKYGSLDYEVVLRKRIGGYKLEQDLLEG